MLNSRWLADSRSAGKSSKLAARRFLVLGAGGGAEVLAAPINKERGLLVAVSSCTAFGSTFVDAVAYLGVYFSNPRV